MPEAQSDIDYTVDIGRHEMTFRANTPKGEEFLGGVDLTMSNEEAHTFIQDDLAIAVDYALVNIPPTDAKLARNGPPLGT